jgi:hypothetical protein
MPEPELSPEPAPMPEPESMPEPLAASLPPMPEPEPLAPLASEPEEVGQGTEEQEVHLGSHHVAPSGRVEGSQPERGERVSR